MPLEQQRGVDNMATPSYTLLDGQFDPFDIIDDGLAAGAARAHEEPCSRETCWPPWHTQEDGLAKDPTVCNCV